MGTDIEENSIDKKQEEQEPWHKGPIKYIIMLFLLLIIVLWVFPAYSIRLDPEPKMIPSIEDISPEYDLYEVYNSSVSTKIEPTLIKPNEPIVKYVADRVAAISCDGNKICQAKAIYYFVRDNFDYVADPNAYEYVKSAKQSLITKAGDCDDAAVLLANLEEAIGVKTRFVFIPNHVYIEAYLPEAIKRYKSADDWVSLDATCKTCVFGEIPLENIKKRKLIQIY